MKHNKTGDKYLSEVKKADIIKQFEELGYVVTPIKDAKETFAYYFSNMDMNGLDSLLTNKHKYDGDTKEYYLNLINKEFEGFKSHNVHYLKPIPGICNGCKNGCSGYTFLDELDGFYINMIIEVKDLEITDLIECFNFTNEVEVPNKKEQLLIKPFLKLDKDGNDVPF